MAKRKKTYDDDDGRVIANMNVDGMPWYISDGAMRRNRTKKTDSSSDFSDLSKGETREIVKGAVLAGLLIGGIFIAACLIFILFCIFVWFK